MVLAHGRDIPEGVATQAIARCLSELGCDYAQGSLFGRGV
jgi:EAL domain-containing protein (putative c-di-GMP-specific phosphodiesterase class I)